MFKLSEISVVGQLVGFEENLSRLYDKSRASNQKEFGNSLDYMTTLKAKTAKDLNSLKTRLQNGELGASGDREKLNLYLTPYLDSISISSLTKREDGVNFADPGQALAFFLTSEKESLLVYQGLIEVLAAGTELDNIIEDKRAAVLSLQDAAKELSADIDDLLTAAMNSEYLAMTFYKKAAAKAQSRAGKKLFTEFAQFEKKHFDRVQGIIAARQNGVKFETMGETDMAPQSKSEVVGEFEPNKDEILDIIMLAIEAEKNAQARYRKIADSLDDPEGKELFSRFSQDERTHQRILEDQLAQMSNRGMILWE